MKRSMRIGRDWRHSVKLFDAFYSRLVPSHGQPRRAASMDETRAQSDYGNDKW